MLVVSPAPPALIPGGFYGPSLLVEITLDKFLDHLPLYRLEQRFLRLHGVKIPRQSMSDNLAHRSVCSTPWRIWLVSTNSVQTSASANAPSPAG